MRRPTRSWRTSGETITTPQGEQLKSTIDQYIRDALGRLTWQINQKNKFAAFFNRTWKRKGKDFGAGSDPRAGSYRDPRTGKYAVGQAKYTNTLDRPMAAGGGLLVADQPHHDRQRTEHQPSALSGERASSTLRGWPTRGAPTRRTTSTRDAPFRSVAARGSRTVRISGPSPRATALWRRHRM